MRIKQAFKAIKGKPSRWTKTAGQEDTQPTAAQTGHSAVNSKHSADFNQLHKAPDVKIALTAVNSFYSSLKIVITSHLLSLSKCKRYFFRSDDSYLRYFVTNFYIFPLILIRRGWTPDVRNSPDIFSVILIL